MTSARAPRDLWTAAPPSRREPRITASRNVTAESNAPTPRKSTPGFQAASWEAWSAFVEAAWTMPTMMPATTAMTPTASIGRHIFRASAGMSKPSASIGSAG